MHVDYILGCLFFRPLLIFRLKKIVFGKYQKNTLCKSLDDLKKLSPRLNKFEKKHLIITEE